MSMWEIFLKSSRCPTTCGSRFASTGDLIWPWSPIRFLKLACSIISRPISPSKLSLSSKTSSQLLKQILKPYLRNYSPPYRFLWEIAPKRFSEKSQTTLLLKKWSAQWGNFLFILISWCCFCWRSRKPSSKSKNQTLNFHDIWNQQTFWCLKEKLVENVVKHYNMVRGPVKPRKE